MVKFIGQILKGIAAALAAGIRLPFDVLGDITKMLGLAPAGTPLPPTEAFDASVDVEAAQLRHELDTAPANVAAPEAAMGDIGQIVHAYAAGSKHTKDSFDMSELEAHISVALLKMHPAQLQRLALAGSEACGRWADGKKGIVGVPLPDRILFRAPVAGNDGPAIDERDAARRPAPRVA